MKKSPLSRGDFPQGIPSGRGVSIGFSQNSDEHPLDPPLLRGTAEVIIKNRTQVYNIIMTLDGLIG